MTNYICTDCGESIPCHLTVNSKSEAPPSICVFRCFGSGECDWRKSPVSDEHTERAAMSDRTEKSPCTPDQNDFDDITGGGQ